MHYTELGLVNTNGMLGAAKRGGYAVPGFNFYNMETLTAIMDAVTATASPVILSVSESALKYMGDDILIAMTSSVIHHPLPIALHLDHGASFEICKHAIDIGFSSVMIDASALSLDDNIALTKSVVDYAHKHNVSVEGELGVLSGIEDDVSTEYSAYTNPDDAVKFVTVTGVDSFAVAIGTSHGAYKRKSAAEHLRFDILEKIATMLPNTPLVLHGASTIPKNLVEIINANGGDIKNAFGIPIEQIRRAIKSNITKINIDSDGRLAFTAAIRKSFFDNPENFNPREYLGAARRLMTQTYINTIKQING